MKLKGLSKKISVTAIIGLFIANSAMPVMAKEKDKLTGNGKEVKNVILLVSDGMGYNQVLAADYYENGKEKTQPYEKFPTQVGMSTYSVSGSYNQGLWDDFYSFKKNPTDSAAAATAMSTGVKTYNAAIGVDNDKNNVKHIAEDFEELGKSTGVVSSVQFSHATPAGFVAHNSNRNDYSGIANEMLKSSATDVIMGAGNPNYNDNGQDRTPSVNDYRYVGGKETWDALVDSTLDVSDANNDGKADPWTLVQSKDEFEKLTNGETPERVVGVAQVATTLQQGRSGDSKADAYEVPFNENVTDLATMTKGALNVLDNNEEGFFLMVEGGAIDWAGHANQNGRVIEEQIEFNDAVDAACDWVEENSNWNETLVIVTGDHETGYLTGQEGVYIEVGNKGKGNMPTMAWNSGDHTNQLIPFYAKGKGAEVFKKLADEKDSVRGNYIDNTEISKVIRELIK